MMKIYLILGLLVTAAYAEKKINLEDIEGDNLRAESKTKVESIRTEETKYTAKPNLYQQQQYQIPSQYNGLDAPSEPYIPLQQLQNLRYTQALPEAYVQAGQYAVHELQHKQSNQILPQQNLPPLQYYSAYQQQAEIPAKPGVAAIAFESQRLNYQPEVVVGNHVQSVQQKTVTEKYTKPISKEPAYLDIPMTQLLSYYPHLDINSLRTVGLAQAPLTAQQISVPIYTPVYDQKQLLPPVKASYPSVAPAAYATKATNGPFTALPATSKKLTSAVPVLTTPLYIQPQAQPVAPGKTLLHTQAYIAPMQPQQYVQQLVYSQPGIVYGDPAAAYSNLYTRVPAYIQDNFLRGQSPGQYQGQSVNAGEYQYQIQQYVAPAIGQEAPKGILQEQIGQDLTYAKQVVAEQPKTYFVPPQLPHGKFKSDITQLEPVFSENEQALPLQDHSLPSEPRSLLDTYIPSNIIAAQDSARYRERPIKLEGGFLPSKTNFALKRRRSE